MITWAERAKAAIAQTGQSGTAKTDETPVPGVLAVSAVPTEAVSAKQEELSSVLAVPIPAVFENPDRWCWPHSTAMNGSEIDTFTSRIHLFGARGLDVKEAEALAYRLTQRERAGDQWPLCMLCRHLRVQPVNHWRDYVELRCGNWRVAGLCVSASDAGLSIAMVRQLQHCDGFQDFRP